MTTNQYDNPEFLAAYTQMSRSQFGLMKTGFIIEAVEEAIPPEQ